MIGLQIDLDGTGAFADWVDRPIHHVTEGLRLAGLAAGMRSGKPSVMIGVPLEDGSVVMAETSLAILLTATEALLTRYGDPR